METNQITYDDFKKVEIKVGEIKEIEIIEGSDKLLKLKVDFNNEERQILSGIKKYFEDPQSLVGKKVPFVTNLAPRMMMGLESQGMILAVHDDEDNFSLLEVDSKIKSGSTIS
jgi:methionyl-tRNA synthetase